MVGHGSKGVEKFATKISEPISARGWAGVPPVPPVIGDSPGVGPGFADLGRALGTQDRPQSTRLHGDYRSAQRIDYLLTHLLAIKYAPQHPDRTIRKPGLWHHAIAWAFKLASPSSVSACDQTKFIFISLLTTLNPALNRAYLPIDQFYNGLFPDFH